MNNTQQQNGINEMAFIIDMALTHYDISLNALTSTNPKHPDSLIAEARSLICHLWGVNMPVTYKVVTALLKAKGHALISKRRVAVVKQLRTDHVFKSDVKKYETRLHEFLTNNQPIEGRALFIAEYLTEVVNPLNNPTHFELQAQRIVLDFNENSYNYPTFDLPVIKLKLFIKYGITEDVLPGHRDKTTAYLALMIAHSKYSRNMGIKDWLHLAIMRENIANGIIDIRRIFTMIDNYRCGGGQLSKDELIECYQHYFPEATTPQTDEGLINGLATEGLSILGKTRREGMRYAGYAEMIRDNDVYDFDKIDALLIDTGLTKDYIRGLSTAEYSAHVRQAMKLIHENSKQGHLYMTIGDAVPTPLGNDNNGFLQVNK